MLHKGMSIAVECNGRVLVAEDLGKRFHVHTAFKSAGSERVSQRVKAFVRNFQLF